MYLEMRKQINLLEVARSTIENDWVNCSLVM